MSLTNEDGFTEIEQPYLMFQDDELYIKLACNSDADCFACKAITLETI
jgi:hypothetical protein